MQEMEDANAAGRGNGHQTVDIDDLLDDPELERLHAERLYALQKEAEKRFKLQQRGHGEVQEIEEGQFLQVQDLSSLMPWSYQHYYELSLKKLDHRQHSILWNRVICNCMVNLFLQGFGRAHLEALSLLLLQFVFQIVSLLPHNMPLGWSKSHGQLHMQVIPIISNDNDL